MAGGSRPLGLPRRRFGGGDAEENFAGLNCQEGQADAALDEEFFANLQHMLLHGCASVRLGRVRTLREKGRERPSPPAQEEGRIQGRRAILRTPGARGSALMPFMSNRSRQSEFSEG